MRNEAVTQRVHRDALVEHGRLGCCTAGPVELARRDGLAWLLTGEEPAARAIHPPPLSHQQLGHKDAVTLLDQTLSEETKTDQLFTQLGGTVNSTGNGEVRQGRLSVNTF